MKVLTFDPWHAQLLVGVFITLTAVILKTKTPWQLKLPWTYFLIYSAVYGVSLSLEPLTPQDFVLKMLSLKSFAVLILLWLFSRDLKSCGPFVALRFIFAVLVIDCAWLLGGGNGMFEGNTHDTTVMAIVLPLMIPDKIFRWAIPILGLTIGVIHGATSFLILASYMAVFAFRLRMSWLEKSLVAAGLGVSIYWLAQYKPFGVNRWTSAWRDHLLYWAESNKVVWGFGPGSYEWISYTLREKVGYEQYWLHSDWLQFAFETGLVGLAFALLAYGFMLWRLRYNTIFLLAWVGLGIGMTFYSPIQFFSVQVVAAYLMRESFRKADLC